MAEKKRTTVRYKEPDDYIPVEIRKQLGLGEFAKPEPKKPADKKPAPKK